MHPGDYEKLKAASGVPGVAAVNERPPLVETRTNVRARGPPLDDDVLLTGTQTRARVGNVSAMCVWRWMRNENVRFPKPLQINGRNYWRLGDLRAWQAERANQKAA